MNMELYFAPLLVQPQVGQGGAIEQGDLTQEEVVAPVGVPLAFALAHPGVARANTSRNRRGESSRVPRTAWRANRGLSPVTRSGAWALSAVARIRSSRGWAAIPESSTVIGWRNASVRRPS